MKADQAISPLVIVGAGPAGLAAAVTAGLSGVPLVLIDAGARTGGQYWRHCAKADRGDMADHRLAELLDKLHALVTSGVVTHYAGKQVWLIQTRADGRFVLRCNDSGAVAGGEPIRMVIADRLLLCPGGYDRQLPIPGWDLPGVMTAGGLQAMLKEHQIRAGTRILLAGTGPFLLPVATALAAAGASVVGICEANRASRWWRGRKGLVTAGGVLPGKLIEAGGYAAKLAKYRIPYYQGTVVNRISGENQVTAATITRRDGSRRRTVAVDTVGLGWGFTPSLELALGLGADTSVDTDGSLVAVVDNRQLSSVAGVWIAGEATGVGGAVKADCEGQLAGLAIAADVGVPVDSALAVSLQRNVRAWRGFAAAMHRAHPVPNDWSDHLTPETVICRCEDVTLAQVQTAQRDLLADGPRLVKLVTRAGMGWCQGRVCGYAVGRLCSGNNEPRAADLAALAGRPLAFPVTLSDIAEAEDSE